MNTNGDNYVKENDRVDRIKNAIMSRKFVSLIIGVLLFFLLPILAMFPATSNFTIVECEDVKNIETCKIIGDNLQQSILGIISEVINASLSDGEVVPTVVPTLEVTETAK